MGMIDICMENGYGGKGYGKWVCGAFFLFVYSLRICPYTFGQ